MIIKMLKNKDIKAVLFDLDGTLIDTERVYRACWPVAFAKFGYNLTDEQALEKRSLGQPYVYDYFKNLFGPDINYDEIKSYCVELVEARLREEGIILKPGVLDFLSYLKSINMKTAIVTASDLDRTKKYIESLNIIKYFDEIISTKSVEKGKPAPDVYEYAARELSLSPSECIAIEDSPNGVLSAYEAGCNVVMIPDQSEPDATLKQKLVACFDNMSQMIDFVK